MTDTLPVSRNLSGADKRYRHSASGGGNQIWRRWWSETSPRTRASLQIGLLVLVVAIAYNYSLTTLLQSANQDTPLAYVSLVPAIALALAAIRARPAKPEPDIHDRHVDYTVGLPLIAAAISVNLLLPSRWSTMFWVYRVDLFTLPFFVAGAVAIIFGVRIMWRQKLAITYLFLAWPYPYQSVLLRVLDAFTAATLFGIRSILSVIHVATPVSSLDNSLFNVVHDGHSFPLSVVSACSGVNSVVGFLLVGSAFGAVVRGPLFRKVAWLLGGMLFLWVINLGRIIFIFWAGRTWGENVAINILHPFVGMVTFSIGVVIMTLLIGPLGMHVGFGPSAKDTRTTPGVSNASTDSKHRRSQGVPDDGGGADCRSDTRCGQLGTPQLQPRGQCLRRAAPDCVRQSTGCADRLDRSAIDHLRLGQTLVRIPVGMEPLRDVSDFRRESSRQPASHC